jgi:hypothetical protein
MAVRIDNGQMQLADQDPTRPATNMMVALANLNVKNCLSTAALRVDDAGLPSSHRPHTGLPNEERPIDFPPTPKLMNDRPVAMLTAGNGRYPSNRHAQQ